MSDGKTLLSELERQLIKQMDMLEIRGKSTKRDGKVPVLLPPEVQTAMAFLATDEAREAAGIPDRNVYFFANQGMYTCMCMFIPFK